MSCRPSLRIAARSVLAHEVRLRGARGHSVGERIESRLRNRAELERAREVRVEAERFCRAGAAAIASVVAIVVAPRGGGLLGARLGSAARTERRLLVAVSLQQRIGFAELVGVGVGVGHPLCPVAFHVDRQQQLGQRRRPGGGGVGGGFRAAVSAVAAAGSVGGVVRRRLGQVGAQRAPAATATQARFLAVTRGR